MTTINLTALSHCAARRPPLPDWAIWSFMAGLYIAAGQVGRAECAIINLIAVTSMLQGVN